MAAVGQQVRHEWYQTESKVVVTLFIKNAQNRNCEINVKSDSVQITAEDLPVVTFNLLHTIDQNNSSYKISPLKIELTLVKLGFERWATLEKTGENAPTPAAAVPVQSAPIAVEAPKAPSGSNKVTPKNPKDWDKLVKDIWEKEDLEKVSTLQIDANSEPLPSLVTVIFFSHHSRAKRTR